MFMTPQNSNNNKYMLKKVTNQMYFKEKESGIALLIAVITAGLAIAVGVTMFDLTIKRDVLTSTENESVRAFYAANAGIECAVKVGRNDVDITDLGKDITFHCLGTSTTIMSPTTTDSGRIVEYRTSFDWTSDNKDVCTEIEMYVIDASGNSSVPKTFENNRRFLKKDCKASNVCTVVFSRGFDVSCNDRIGSSIVNIVQRELTIEF